MPSTRGADSRLAIKTVTGMHLLELVRSKILVYFLILLVFFYLQVWQAWALQDLYIDQKKKKTD